MATLKKMTLSNGPKFNFEITFMIPVNTAYTKIEIVDALPAGLTYDGNIAPVTFTSTVTTTPTTLTSVEYPTDPIAEPNTIKITFDDLANLRPATDNTVDVLIPVTVTNIDDLMDAQAAAVEAGIEFENQADIIPYTAQGARTPLQAEQPLEITECNMYGFGSSYEINTPEGSKANLIFAHPTIYSEDNTNLVYKTIIALNPALDYDLADPAVDLNIYDINNNIIGTIPAANIVYDDVSTPKTLTLTYPHIAQFSEKTVYIVVPVVANRVLTEDESPLRNATVTSLSYTPDGGTSEVICSSNEYSIELIVVGDVPPITGADKSVSLTLN